MSTVRFQIRNRVVKTAKLLFAAALVAAAIVSATSEVTAAGWCNTCAADPSNCFACCKCDGFSTNYCINYCGI